MYNLADNIKMDAGFSSYHNGGPAREQDFGKLSQTIGTSILKISQNGEYRNNRIDLRIVLRILTLILLQYLPCKKWSINWVARLILKNSGINCKLQSTCRDQNQ